MTVVAVKAIALIAIAFSTGVEAVAVHRHLRHDRAPAISSNTSSTSGNQSVSEQGTFLQFVDSRTTGRGIWKWSNALWAYETHFSRYKQQTLKLAEVGVWSGGSLDMWHAVLGPNVHVYGFDIMDTALSFQDAKTTITIMDQGDPNAWTNFFSTVSPKLDVLVDDGGHEAHQMQTTTTQVWPRINPGGVLAVEDIVGAHYLQDFFLPVAQFYGGQVAAEVASLHLYSLILIAEKNGPNKAPIDPSTWGGAVATVSSMEQLSAAVTAAAPGSKVVLHNPTWGTLINADLLSQIFTAFIGMCAPAQMVDSPQGCSQTSNAVCTYGVVNSEQQAKIQGVHILPSKVVVEMAAQTPVIQAVRHGSEWVQY